MEQIEFGQKLNRPIVLCLGYFGCMHSGHVGLVNAAKRLAERYHAKVALFTFSNNHLALLGKEQSVLYTYDERLQLYRSLDVDIVLHALFDERFRALSGEQFARMLQGYQLQAAVCGFDYTFGCDRQDCQRLVRYLDGVCPVEVVSEMRVGRDKISTTLVRKLLGQNDIAQANALLSEPFFVTGRVVHGRHVGSEMGFPTANIEVPQEKFLPTGVFGGDVELDGRSYRAIVNIGQRPTFGLSERAVEVHIINFDGDLYGRTLKLSLTQYLRPICRFDNEQQLAAQLCADRQKVLNDQIRSKRK